MNHPSAIPPLILASGSPRRAQLLRGLGIPFVVEPTDVTEHLAADTPAGEAAGLLARRKAAAHPAAEDEQRVIIAADTVVILENRILNKPASVREAHLMLSDLSGKTHRVVTGVCVRQGSQEIAFQEESRVTFRKMRPTEIERYVEQFHPLDKAGAYGIQECLPADLDPLSDTEREFVERIGQSGLAAECRRIDGLRSPVVLIHSLEGSFFNVVGLPIASLWHRVRPLIAAAPADGR